MYLLFRILTRFTMVSALVDHKVACRRNGVAQLASCGQAGAQEGVLSRVDVDVLPLVDKIK